MQGKLRMEVIMTLCRLGLLTDDEANDIIDYILHDITIPRTK